DFGVEMAWDVDLLAGHDHEFLPRQWPTKDPLDYSWKGLNKGIYKNLKEGWDAVYIAGYAHLNNWYIAYCCKRLGIPVLCQCDTNILNALGKNRFKLLLKKIMVSFFLSMVDGYLAVGNHNRNYLLHYGATQNRIFFCPIPVDIERFRNTVKHASADDFTHLLAQYGIAENKKLIIFCGKFVPWKRPQDLVAAIEELGRDDIVGLFVGDGPMCEEIEKLKNDKIVVTGFVNQSEIPLITKMGAISVIPSSRDNHPLSATESLCLGIPVILMWLLWS
ncbi:MAG: glycosyltransferase family 4 protein, partial [Planctomycetota bacterium]